MATMITVPQAVRDVLPDLPASVRKRIDGSISGEGMDTAGSISVLCDRFGIVEGERRLMGLILNGTRSLSLVPITWYVSSEPQPPEVSYGCDDDNVYRRTVSQEGVETYDQAPADSMIGTWEPWAAVPEVPEWTPIGESFR